MKRSFWDILAWICLGYIALWTILKMFGIINTPDWIIYSPLIGAIYIAGSAMNQLNRATEDISELKSETSSIKNKLNCLELDFHVIKRKCPLFKK